MTRHQRKPGRWRPRRLIGLLVALSGLTMFLVGLVGTTTAGATPQNNGGGRGGDNNLKVFVCKYVGKPGVDERLQTGQNPIDVSVNSIKDYNGVGSYFNDAQGRSYVLAEDHGQPTPDVSECPAPQGPPPSSTPPPPPPTASGSATRSCPSGTVTGTVSATGIPGANDNGYYQGLLFLVYQNSPLDQEVSNAHGDVTFHFSTDAVPQSASSFTVEIQSPTQSGGVDITVSVSVEGTCQTSTPPSTSSAPPSTSSAPPSTSSAPPSTSSAPPSSSSTPPPGHPTTSGSATRSCPSGTVTATVSATGIPGPNSSGYYQGLLFLVYKGAPAAQAISNAHGDVTFKDVVLTSVPKTATSFTVEIQSPTQSGGVDITVKVRVTGTCSTSSPPPPTHTKTKTVTPPPPPTHTKTVTTTAAPPAPPSTSVFTPGSGGTGDTPLASTGGPYKLLTELGLALMVGGAFLFAGRRRQGARQH